MMVLFNSASVYAGNKRSLFHKILQNRGSVVKIQYYKNVEQRAVGTQCLRPCDFKLRSKRDLSWWTPAWRPYKDAENYFVRLLNIAKIAIFSLFLTACVSQKAQFQLPEQIDFQGKSYQKVTDNRLDEMRQLLYLPTNSDKNPENWQQGILLFVDQNSAQKSLNERLQLRQQAFAKQPATQAKLAIEQDELRSQVIYPPTERFNDVLLEVSRGRELSCGFGQMQFSDKRSVLAKSGQNVTAYQAAITQLALQFSTLPWLIKCGN